MDPRLKRPDSSSPTEIMKMKHIFLVFMVAAVNGPLFLLCESITINLSGAASAAVKAGGRPSGAQKQQVFDLLKTFETHAAAPRNVINPNKYIQHNLNVADGKTAFADMTSGPTDGSKVNTVRVFQDQDLVFTHSYYLDGPSGKETAGFDIFRFEKGQIVEHWDNRQDLAEKNPSGRTMLDGPTAVADLTLTKANKDLVRGMMQNILVDGALDNIGVYFNCLNYLQHDPALGDGLLPFYRQMALAAVDGSMKYTKISRIMGEGNFVLVVSEGEQGGQLAAYYDLFRVDKGKIAEHWNTMEIIPDSSEWKNTNGKF
ncbi:hypothetical protein BV898_14374 [Hypsibius exemplaris]|uniref:SnoaL-like domain-containing protein n=1 Tax=Hypsibius exemplaris TaxID=2072580 RepID=A0A9X6RJD1_HYPEX|nr:hypothetical protein BV898_14374 [Hypsibius exemplaris]